MKKLILLCAVVAGLVLLGGSWKWAVTSAKGDDAATVAEVVPLGTGDPAITADVVSADGSGAVALPNDPVVANVTTSDGQTYYAILIPANGTTDTPSTAVSINGSWGW